MSDSFASTLLFIVLAICFFLIKQGSKETRRSSKDSSTKDIFYKGDFKVLPHKSKRVHATLQKKIPPINYFVREESKLSPEVSLPEASLKESWTQEPKAASEKSTRRVNWQKAFILKMILEKPKGFDG